MNGKRLLFFGELAPTVVHGISLANKLNTDLLSEICQVDIEEELNTLNEHEAFTFNKIKKQFKYIRRIFFLNKSNNYDYFYTVFSLSTLGGLKTLLSMVSFWLSGRGKIILHIHRGDFGRFYDKSFLNKLISTLVFSVVDKLIVLSENQKIEFSKYLNENKIHIVENSLNEEYRFSGKETNTQKFVYISNYLKEKGIFELLSAFERDGARFLECFGRFVNNEENIKCYQSENIRINGFVNGEEKFEVIRKSDALILPSWNEGQPTIILEAMMVGTIVLTTKVGLIGEILGENYPFYFEPQSVESLQECIDKFIAYENKQELSDKLIKLYFDNFSKQVHLEKLIKVFS